MQPIYLDHNATTPLLPAAADALDAAHRAGFANAASQHAAGRRARRALEDARERIGTLLGAEVGTVRGDRVIFVSGGTEANHLAVAGLGQGDSTAHGADSALLVSAVEHPSLRGAAERQRRRGEVVELIPVDHEGRVDPEDIATRLKPTTRLASVMLGNHETGVLQPVTEFAQVCRSRGVLIHTDAVQAIGKIPVDFRALGVDAMSVAAHKFHGPLGIGALVVRAEAPLAPLLVGGFQQGGMRAGTEPVALVLGFLAALEAWHRESAVRTSHLAAMRDEFEAQLVSVVPSAVVIGGGVARLPQTSCIAFVGIDRQALLLALDQAGVYCSTGSACASGSSEPSPTLVAMGRSDGEIRSSLRFSVGASTTTAEVREAVERIRRVTSDFRRLSERRKIPADGR